ncbi:MAG TPA: hypothetical protein PKY59_21790 [Pyrinomonadaceae bacterium]|nr:hypothetical protein [Pyrinomonadaceae bacterium]
MKKNWVLTQEAFDAFLKWLSPNREEAAQIYEKIRRNLIALFDFRGCENSEELADEAINRVAEKLLKSEEDNPIYSIHFIYGVARLIYLEQTNKRKQLNIDDQNIAAETEIFDDGDRQDCMKKCLQELAENDRLLIVKYYNVDKETKIKRREAIAAQNEISMNNLRVKIKRIREKLRDCRKKCLEKNNL